MRVSQIDTGIDPPGTSRYSEELLGRYENLHHSVIHDDDLFWRAMERLGPPAYDFQWCRSVLKNAAPYRVRSRLVSLLKYIGPILRPRVVLVDGPRRREEPWLVALKKAVEIPDAPVETITVRPILEFTDLDVWMYIHHHDLPLHPTYTRAGTQRLLCLFCPERDCGEFEAARRSQPQQWERFRQGLERWREIFDFPPEWVSENLWVWDAPRSQRARELGITSRVEVLAERLNRHVRSGPFEPSPDGSWTVHGRVTTEFSPGSLGRWLQPLGRVSRPWGRGHTDVQCGSIGVELQDSGDFRVNGPTEKAVRGCARILENWISSHLNCVGCGACRAALEEVHIQGERATMGWNCGPNVGGLKEAVRLCPFNAVGVRACTRNSQYG
jgi:3'-phosphoadenosine 5'-phosphosulfate sulfotransferase (PAPS reductase)/FAD synthetase